MTVEPVPDGCPATGVLPSPKVYAPGSMADSLAKVTSRRFPRLSSGAWDSECYWSNFTH